MFVSFCVCVVWNLYIVDALILGYHLMSLTNEYTLMAPNPYQDIKLDQYAKKFSHVAPQFNTTSLVKATTLLNCFLHSLIHPPLDFCINGIMNYLLFCVKLVSCCIYFWDAPVLFHVFIFCSFLLLLLKNWDVIAIMMYHKSTAVQFQNIFITTNRNPVHISTHSPFPLSPQLLATSTLLSIDFSILGILYSIL